MRHWLIVTVAVLCVAGCATQSIHERYRDRLGNVDVGMSKTAFASIFPEAYIGGQTGALTAYVLESERYAPRAPGHDRWTGMVKDKLHFYFRNDELLRWGKPGDWEADLKVQIEHQ